MRVSVFISDGPVAPPRRNRDAASTAGDEPEAPKTLYEKLPESLKNQMLVRAKVVEDDATLKQRQELCR